MWLAHPTGHARGHLNPSFVNCVITAAAILIAMHTWLWVGGIYAVLSLITFAVYAWDKRAARLGAQRTPETTLHFLELVGGWPGALVAQRLMRHKNAKVSYQCVFWLIVAVHLAGWVAVLRSSPIM